MRNKNTIFVLVMMILLVGRPLDAQYTVNSAYTLSGIGDISKKGFAENRAMGGLALSLRRNANINYLNPASYTGIDSLSFIFDIGALGSYYHSTTEGISEDLEMYNMNINHVTIGFPVTEWLKTSIGVVPYSKIGYNIRENMTINGTEIDRFYKGSGGLNQFYIGNSIELFDRLAVGVNVSYLFGSIDDEERINYIDSEYWDTQIEQKYILGDFFINYGIQYFDKLNENIDFAIGASFTAGTNINAEQDKSVRWVDLSSNGTMLSVYDTIQTTPDSIDNTFDFNLPANFGIGASINFSEKLLIGLDYYSQNWEGNGFRNDAKELSNYNSLHFGAEYVPDRYSIRSYFDHIRYRVGAYYTNTNLNINDNQIVDKGVTLGLGFPLGQTNTTFNFAFELGQKGNVELVKEQYVNFVFNLTLHDFWFFKRKFD